MIKRMSNVNSGNGNGTGNMNNVTYNTIKSAKTLLNKNTVMMSTNKAQKFLQALRTGGLLNTNGVLLSNAQSMYNDSKFNANKKQVISNATRKLNAALKTQPPATQAQSASVTPGPSKKGNNNKGNNNKGNKKTSTPTSPSTGSLVSSTPGNGSKTSEILIENWWKSLDKYSSMGVLSPTVFQAAGSKSLPLALRQRFFKPSAKKNYGGMFKKVQENISSKKYPRIAELYACVFLALPGWFGEKISGTSYVFTLEEQERRNFLLTDEFGEWFDQMIGNKLENNTNTNKETTINTYMKDLVDHVMVTYNIENTMKIDYLGSATSAYTERKKLKLLRKIKINKKIQQTSTK